MFVFFKQKTAYDVRISDWSSDVCSSDLPEPDRLIVEPFLRLAQRPVADQRRHFLEERHVQPREQLGIASAQQGVALGADLAHAPQRLRRRPDRVQLADQLGMAHAQRVDLAQQAEIDAGDEGADAVAAFHQALELRSEEHTSELQSLMRISYAVFCL